MVEDQTIMVLNVNARIENHERISLAVRKTGFNVVDASTGKEGLRLSKTSRPSIIILDTALPDITGQNMRQQLRSNPNTQLIPIVFLTTAYEEKLLKMPAPEGGIEVYLDYNVDTKLLLATLTVLIRAHQAEMQLRRKGSLLEGINKVLRKALVSKTAKEVAMTCLNIMEEITMSKFGLIGELNEQGRFDTLAYTDPGMEACKMPKDIAWQKSLNMEVRGAWAQPIIERTGMIIDAPSSHPASVGTPEGHPPIESFIGVPLKRGNEVVGLIAGANKEGGYTQEDLDDLETLSVVFMEALIRKRVEQHLIEEIEELRREISIPKD